MKDTNGRKKPKSSGRTTPELRVVEVHYKPAPDSRDRLRRLTTLLIKYATEHKQAKSSDDSPSDDTHADDYAGEEA